MTHCIYPKPISWWSLVKKLFIGSGEIESIMAELIDVDPTTGHISEKLPEIILNLKSIFQRGVSNSPKIELFENIDHWKIGITTDPQKRAAEHSDYDFMCLVFATGIRNYCQHAERVIIDHFETNERLDNRRAGGAGRLSLDYSRIYYVYVIWKCST